MIDIQTRALRSLGISGDPIYRMVADAIAERHADGGILIDVGCGVGSLWGYLCPRFDKYIGVDVVRYDGMPDEIEFHRIDLDSGRVPLPDAAGDVVVAVETIEHLENPRTFVRELTRMAKPGGWVVVTTPNQLSLPSKLTLAIKNEFNAFQVSSYPTHLTALLETDLRRIAAECGWVVTSVAFTLRGRIPGTGRHWPRWLSRLAPRAMSDNVLMIGRKPGHGPGGADGESGDRDESITAMAWHESPCTHR